MQRTRTPKSESTAIEPISKKHLTAVYGGIEDGKIDRRSGSIVILDDEPDEDSGS